ncbi:MAG: hypothetical protein Q6365_003220 [Candidatus Sigynarchaeota archaeon]
MKGEVIFTTEGRSHLDLSNKHIERMEDVYRLDECVELKTLILNENKIINVNIPSSLKAIEELYLNDNRIQDMAWVVNLNRFPRLRKVSLSGNRIYNFSNLNVFLGLHDLVELNLSYNFILYCSPDDEAILFTMRERGINVELEGNRFFSAQLGAFNQEERDIAREHALEESFLPGSVKNVLYTLDEDEFWEKLNKVLIAFRIPISDTSFWDHFDEYDDIWERIDKMIENEASKKSKAYHK